MPDRSRDLDAILDVAPLAIIATARDGTVMLWSRGATRIFGWRRDEIEGKALPFDTPADRARDEMLRQRILAGNELRDQATQRTDHDGETRKLILNAAPLRDDAGNITGLIMAIEDVTAREAPTKEAAPPVTIDAAKFISRLSHDMRQPLQALSLVTGALERRARDSSLRDLIDHLADVVRSAQGTFESLVEWAKLENGLIAATTMAFPLVDLLQPLAQEIEEEAKRRNVIVRCLPSTARAMTDPILLRRILRHLLDNALKFAPSGQIVLGARRHGKALRLIVADSGVGIRADEQASVFAEFAQGEAGREVGGLGLGLSSAQRLAAMLETRIEFRSIAGKGSQFWIDVPAA